MAGPAVVIHRIPLQSPPTPTFLIKLIQLTLAPNETWYAEVYNREDGTTHLHTTAIAASDDAAYALTRLFTTPYLDGTLPPP